MHSTPSTSSPSPNRFSSLLNSLPPILTAPISFLCRCLFRNRPPPSHAPDACGPTTDLLTERDRSDSSRHVGTCDDDKAAAGTSEIVEFKHAIETDHDTPENDDNGIVCASDSATSSVSLKPSFHTSSSLNKFPSSSSSSDECCVCLCSITPSNPATGSALCPRCTGSVSVHLQCYLQWVESRGREGYCVVCGKNVEG